MQQFGSLPVPKLNPQAKLHIPKLKILKRVMGKSENNQKESRY